MGRENLHHMPTLVNQQPSNIASVHSTAVAVQQQIAIDMSSAQGVGAPQLPVNDHVEIYVMAASDAPVSVKTLATWRRKAMDSAGLSYLRKAGFHCFRRKFASELKDVPLKDLMALGGWKDSKTVIQCYQQADLGRMRDALANRNPLTQSTHPELGLVRPAG